MKKVLDTALQAKYESILKSNATSAEKALIQVQLLKDLQDSSGVKVCTAITKTDVAYREIK